MIKYGMTYLTLLMSLVLAITSQASAAAEDELAEATAPYIHTGPQYPPMLFVTNIDDKDFKTKLESSGAFLQLDPEAIGAPIGIRVLKGYHTKQDGTQFSTLMLSASTLGIIPVVQNTEFKIYYDIFVQGESIAKFEYQTNSTDVSSMWTAGAAGERETKPAEQVFMENTIDTFLNAVQENKDVQAVFDEYRLYFGDNQ